MTNVGKTARQYGKVLFELCAADTNGTSLDIVLETFRTALNAFAELWGSSQDLQAALLHPVIRHDEKIAVLREIASRVIETSGSSAGKKEIFENFLLVLLENGRVHEIRAIAEAFSLIVDEMKDVLTVEITSAFPLSQEEREKVQERIRKKYGELATVHWKVDPEILGGLLIQSGDRLLDSSVRGSLERMRSRVAA